MRERDERTAKQLLKTSAADVSSSWKKTQKNLRVPPPPPPSLLRPRVKSSQRDLRFENKSRWLPCKDQGLKTKTKKKNDIKLKINKKK